MKIKLTLSIIAVSVFLFGCGYEIVNKSKGNNFSIAEINLSGEKELIITLKIDLSSMLLKKIQI